MWSHREAGGDDRPRLPPVWRGRRRRHLVLLTAAGLGQALSAGVASHLMLHSLRHARTTSQLTLLVTGLVVAALLVGALRMGERIVTEQLSQDYVHEIRLRLLDRDLTEGPAASLGVAVARTSNDLTSVRNWVALGIAPLVVGVPLLVGAGAVLLGLGVPLALGFLVPLVLLGLCLMLLAEPTYRRTSDLRAARGRLSGLVADTLLAARGVRAAGGGVRELNRIARRSTAMAEAAVVRSRWAGAQRGAAATAVMLASSGVVVGGVLGGAGLSSITAALTVVGMLSTPMHDLGRVAEYRQTYRAARRIVAPAMRQADVRPAGTPPSSSPGLEPGCLHVGGALTADLGIASLDAGPGERVLVDLGDPQAEAALLDALGGLSRVTPGSIRIGDTDLAVAGQGRRRRLVGYAARGLRFGRASIVTHALYRSRSEPREAAGPLLERVGLAERVAALPEGAETVLRHGGEPLDVGDRARLQLARALCGAPALVVLDRLDADLGPDGCREAGRLLASYPGIVVATTVGPAEHLRPTLVWTAAGVRVAGESTIA